MGKVYLEQLLCNQLRNFLLLQNPSQFIPPRSSLSFCCIRHGIEPCLSVRYCAVCDTLVWFEEEELIPHTHLLRLRTLSCQLCDSLLMSTPTLHIRRPSHLSTTLCPMHKWQKDPLYVAQKAKLYKENCWEIKPTYMLDRHLWYCSSLNFPCHQSNVLV
jgi:hypothetical protein